MPTRERRQQDLAKKEQLGQLEKIFGPRPSVSIQNLNFELGEDLGSYSSTAQKYDETGEPLASKIWQRNHGYRQKGAEATATNAKDRCLEVKRLAGKLWGKTKNIPKIRMICLAEEILLSERTLRRNFKKYP